MYSRGNSRLTRLRLTWTSKVTEYNNLVRNVVEKVEVVHSHVGSRSVGAGEICEGLMLLSLIERSLFACWSVGLQAVA